MAARWALVGALLLPLCSTLTTQCPYSRPYPRYRIDLSRITEEKPQNLPFLADWQRQRDREAVQRQYGSSLTWSDSQTGVDTMADLWKGAAGALEGESVQWLAFSKAKPRWVQQWIDVFLWLQTHLPDDPASDLTISYNIDHNLPVLEFSRTKATPITQPREWPDHATIAQRTKAWVQRVLVEQGICPFTKSTRVSGQGLAELGVPVGKIAYHTSYATSLLPLLADMWQAMADMIAAGPSGSNGVSSILLAAPEYDDQLDLWSGPIFTILETCVVVAQAEAALGVVCFHPRYATPDGSTWPGFGHMHSVPRLQTWLREDDPECPFSLDEIAAGGAWQRRTPHATLNVLRADQLAAAEGKRTSGRLYNDNIRKLVHGIGLEQLELDLERERNM